jgi:hypothetical protein
MIGGELLTSWILPFLLIFVMVFAILEKSKLFGDGNSKIDVIISLVVGFLSVSVPYSREVIVELMPWLGVGLAALFVFFVLYSFVVGDKMLEDDWMKYLLIGIVGIFSVVVIFNVTGFWELISAQNYSFLGEGPLTNLFFILILGLIVFWVMKSSGSGSSNSD